MKLSLLNHHRAALALAALLGFVTFISAQDAPVPGGFAGGNGNAALATQFIHQGDQDADQKVTVAELSALADAWFEKLDPNKRGLVSQEDFTRQFASLLGTTNQAGGAAGFGGPGRAGGGRFGRGGGFGNPPGDASLGFFLAADLDKDGTLTRTELKTSFAEWFARWDSEKTGSLNEEKLLAGLTSILPQPLLGLRGGRGGRGPGGARDVGADFSTQPPVQALSPEESLKRFQLPEGYRLELVLAEPLIQEPVVTAFDGNGRMFVAELRSYMQDINGNNEHDPVSRISMHEDTNGDGQYDRHTVFVDKMILPRFVLPLDGNSILSMETDADEIFKYTDTDGDGVSDKKELFYKGGGRRGNLEHQQSGMVWAMDNWIYTTYNAFRLRWTPDKILRESTGPNGGQWGLTQDNYGKPWFVDAGGERGPMNFQVPIVYGAFRASDQFEPDFEVPWPVAGVGDYEGGMPRARLPDQMLNHFTATCGPDIFRGDRLPAEMRGDLLFAEPVGRLVRRAKVVVTDGLTQLRNAHPKSEFIRSTDLIFRPVNTVTAPDGTLYITDMYRGIIQEGNWVRAGSYLRRKVQQYEFDKIVGHGRIWRLVHTSMEPNRQKPRMLDETPAQLVAHLEHPNGWWRDTAQKLLVLRQDKSVVPALQSMARNSRSELSRIHALWTLEGLNALDAPLVRATMIDANPNLRVQAIRLSESLYKAGDKSLEADVRAKGRDADPNVVIQSMLTFNRQEIPDAATFLRSTLASSKSRGVQEIGGQLMQPPGGRGGGAGGFGGLQLSAAERAVMQRGAAIYQELCFACHGVDGKGAPLAGALEGTTMAPSIAGSTRIQGHRDYVINTILYGLNGDIDGKNYTAVMVPMGSNDNEWIAAVASYIRNSFGNTASFVTPDHVAKVRAANPDRKEPWLIGELEAAAPSLLRYQPDWKLTASHNSNMASYAINSSGSIRWDTGGPQAPGMWFQIELPRPVSITEIELTAAVGGFPREYEVTTSADGKVWSAPAAKGRGETATTLISFAPVDAKYVRITQTGSGPDPPPWSIQKTRLFQPGRGRVTSANAAGSGSKN